MAVSFIATIKRYQCLSSDDKPTSADQPEGSTLHIVDTGEQYLIHGGAWIQDRRLIYALSET